MMRLTKKQKIIKAASGHHTGRHYECIFVYFSVQFCLIWMKPSMKAKAAGQKLNPGYMFQLRAAPASLGQSSHQQDLLRMDGAPVKLTNVHQ